MSQSQHKKLDELLRGAVDLRRGPTSPSGDGSIPRPLRPLERFPQSLPKGDV